MRGQAVPRLLTIMGSGETTPTMVKVHRANFDRLAEGVASDAVAAALIDTPYGFQSNASDISARAVSYFRDSVGRAIDVASLRRAEGEAAGSLEVEAALAKVAEAAWVFSGPGSPTYAVRQWQSTAMPKLLADKLSAGGCITFSSAAALTLGRFTVPVYEVYKAGADPVWHEGLDLLSPLGLDVAVVPHYDNAEGGHHDTRFCFLGEERLAAMEAQLPAGAWVLGVDEHTALVMDLGEGTATVAGLGTVTLRHQGRSVVLGSGETLPLVDLARAALGPTGRGGAGTLSGADAPERRQGDEALPGGAGAVTGGDGAAHAAHAGNPLLDETARLSARFDEALAARASDEATRVMLEMEALVHAWAADTTQSDELDRARTVLRRMLVRLGEVAGTGLRDPREVVGPWVGALLAERAKARADRRYEDSDRIRDVLVQTGVEVRDTPQGTEWHLRGD